MLGSSDLHRETGNHRHYRFKYEGVEYFMMGLMEEGDFEKILKNLVFPK